MMHDVAERELKNSKEAAGSEKGKHRRKERIQQAPAIKKRPKDRRFIILIQSRFSFRVKMLAEEVREESARARKIKMFRMEQNHV